MKNKAKRSTAALTALVLAAFGITLAGCVAGGPAAAARTDSAPPGQPESADPVYFPARTRAELSPVTAPKLPQVIPGYTQYDEDAGLHVTGTYVELELASWRLSVTGAVRTPLVLDYDELRTLPGVKAPTTLICPGFFEDHAVWTGASLAAVLDRAGADPDARGITLVGADGYSSWVDMDQARAPHNLLAYEFAEGRPVPILHGFPVRAVFPSLAGGKWVKWLVEVRVENADSPNFAPDSSVPRT